MFVLGAPENYENGHPINLMGTIHEGGFVVPIIQGLLILVVVLSVERFIALRKARGSKGVDKFVKDLKVALEKDNLSEAKSLCTKQGGAIGNAVLSAVEKYAEMSNMSDAAVSALKKKTAFLLSATLLTNKSIWKCLHCNKIWLSSLLTLLLVLLWVYSVLCLV